MSHLVSIIGIAVHKQASKQTNKQPYRHHSEKISRSARAGATNDNSLEIIFCKKNEHENIAMTNLSRKNAVLKVISCLSLLIH